MIFDARYFQALEKHFLSGFCPRNGSDHTGSSRHYQALVCQALCHRCHTHGLITFLPRQGLCTGHALCLEHAIPASRHGWLLPSITQLSDIHVPPPRETFPDHTRIHSFIPNAMRISWVLGPLLRIKCMAGDWLSV